MKLRNTLCFLEKTLKDNLVIATSMLVVSNPIFAAFEIDTFKLGIGKMTHETSLNAKMMAALTAYGGLSLIFNQGRNLSRKLVRINERSKEITQKVHDSLYSVAYNAIIDPPFYYLAGSRDIKEIAYGTGIGMLFGLTTGWLTGLSVDTYKDLLGIHHSPRISHKVSYAKKSKKLCLAALLTAGSIALTSGVYLVTPNKKVEVNPPQKIERYISQQDSLENVLIQKWK